MKNYCVYKKYIRTLLISLMLFLTACSDSSTQLIETPRSVTSTNTITPLTPTNTKTPIPIPTQTKNMVTTRTPVPTLSADKADARVLELLKTNAGCSLPCWWGITPGITTTDEIQSFLEPFLGVVVSKYRYGFTQDGGAILMRPQPQNGLRIGIQYLAKDKIVSMIYISTELDRDIFYPVYDSPLYQKIMSAYTLQAILAKYGKPDQILIRSYSDLAAYNNPTRILLYYPKEGIVAQYLGDISSAKQENGKFVNWICPPKSSISLRLFNPNSQMSLNDLLVIDDSFPRYKDISEATDMDISMFYQSYQEYNKSGCTTYLQTSWDLWPDEYQNP